MTLSNTLGDADSPSPMSHAEEDRLIKTALEILDRRLFTRGPALHEPSDVRDYVKLKLAAMEDEVFAVIFLDSLYRVMAFEVLFHGTLNAVIMHPRQVIKRALAHNAAAIILAHNHPSGCSTPSPEDRRLTQRLCKGLEMVEVRVLDHLIVGCGEPHSMAEKGWL